jgi:hypothetical protein
VLSSHSRSRNPQAPAASKAKSSATPEITEPGD